MRCWGVGALVVAMALAGCTSAVPGTATPAETPTGTVQPTDPPAAVPTLAELEGTPCTALTDGQVRELGLRPPGAPSELELGLAGRPPVPQCTWYGPEVGVELTLRAQGPAVVDLPPVPGGVPVAPITVAGFPAEQEDFGGNYCAVRVDVPDGLVAVSSFGDVRSTGAPDRGCEVAVAVAERVIGNLTSGLPAPGPSAEVPGPSVVTRWAADPCAALSPAAVEGAVGPGATAQPEEPTRLESACRWTGPAGSLRLAAVVLDTLYPDFVVEERGRQSAVGNRPVIETIEGTTCAVHARFPPSQLLVITVDDPVGGAEVACTRARGAAAELLGI